MRAIQRPANGGKGIDVTEATVEVSVKDLQRARRWHEQLLGEIQALEPPMPSLESLDPTAPPCRFFDDYQRALDPAPSATGNANN